MAVEVELVQHFLNSEFGPGRVLEEVHPKDDMLGFLKTLDQMPAQQRLLDYFRTGRECLRVLENALQATGRSLADQHRVLEFACGYGRVSRFLLQKVQADNLWVSDVLEGGVEFVRDRFGVNGFVSSANPDEVEGLRGFDVIYVVSLFSHLPRPRFQAWLQTLWQALSPDGLLIFSTHGMDLAPADLGVGEFLFRRQSESSVLDVDEYGTTYVTPAEVRSIAAQVGAQHHYCQARDLCFFQDLHVLSRQAIPGLSDWQRTATVRGRMDRLDTQSGQCLLQGWAADERKGAPLAKVEIYAGEVLVGAAELGGKREDVAEVRNSEKFLSSGWSILGQLPASPVTKVILVARGVGCDGSRQTFDVRAVEPTDSGGVRLSK
jgi:SAM-dependent methyltransferase